MISTGLGAGVCSLLGLLWKSQNTFRDDEFKCFSFASPLVIDKDGVDKTFSNLRFANNNNMISVAVSSDVITRLSIRGLVKMKKRVEIIKACDNDKKTKSSYELTRNICNKRCSTTGFTDLEDDEQELIQKLTTIDDHHDDDETKEIPSQMPRFDSADFVKEEVLDDRQIYSEMINSEQAVQAVKASTIDNHDKDKNHDVDLYPAGKILWFVPYYAISDDHDSDSRKGQKYKHLLDRVNSKTTECSLFRLIGFIYNFIMDFEVINNGEELCEINGDRNAFTQMVFNGNESFHAHFPGRYTNGFGIDMIDIFKMSKYSKQICDTFVCIPDFLMDILIFWFVIIMYLISIVFAPVTYLFRLFF